MMCCLRICQRALQLPWLVSVCYIMSFVSAHYYDWAIVEDAGSDFEWAIVVDGRRRHHLNSFLLTSNSSKTAVGVKHFWRIMFHSHCNFRGGGICASAARQLRVGCASAPKGVAVKATTILTPLRGLSLDGPRHNPLHKTRQFMRYTTSWWGRET